MKEKNIVSLLESPFHINNNFGEWVQLAFGEYEDGQFAFVFYMIAQPEIQTFN